MTKRTPILSLCCGVLLLLGAVSASAVPIGPGRALEVPFFLPSAPTSPIGPVDVLSLILNATCSPACAAPSARFELYDGLTLLGSLDLSFAVPFTTFAFTSSTSLFNFRSARIADFSSIADGSIDGRLLITNQSSVPFDFLVTRMAGASLGRATDTNGYVNGTPEPVLGVQREAGLVPEPGSLALALGGMLAWGWSRREKSRGWAPRMRDARGVLERPSPAS